MDIAVSLWCVIRLTRDLCLPFHQETTVTASKDRRLSWPEWLITYLSSLSANGHTSEYKPGWTWSNLVDMHSVVTTGPNCHHGVKQSNHQHRGELESPQSRCTDHFSNIVADREFSTGCYLFTVSHSGLLFIARRSYASAVLGVVILSVRLSVCYTCFVTNPKNRPAIFLYHTKGQSF